MERKRAVVTGGSSGIGRGIVYCLAEADYDVAFSYCSREASAQAVCSVLKLRYPDGRFFCFQADLSEPGVGPHFFRQAANALGGVDLMVNNAGVSPKEGLLDLTEETLDHLLHLNFRAYILLMREAARYMAAHDIQGSIVNVTSTRADRAYPADGIYGGLKAAVNRAVKSFALDVAPYGIRINNVAPGAVQRLTNEEMSQLEEAPQQTQIEYLTPRIPLQRYGQPKDIGRAVVFLASENASYITGETIRIDGGLALPGMPERESLSRLGWGAPDRREISWEEEESAST